MKNKKTIVFIGKDDNCVFGNCLKEQLINDRTYVTVILSASEFSSYYGNVLKERLSKKLSFFKEGKDFIDNSLIKANIDKLIKEDLTFYSKKPVYTKMLNMFIRFNPDLVIMSDYSVILPCLATIKRLNLVTKTIVCIDDFVLDKRLINTNIDLYLAENLEIKRELLNNRIDENKIKIYNLLVKKEFYLPSVKADALKLLGLNEELPTVLIIKNDYSDSTFKKLETSDFIGKFNFINIIDDDNTDLNIPFACADIVLTHPTTKSILKGLVKEKLVFTFAPQNLLEKKIGSYLGCEVTVFNEDSKQLDENLNKYLTDKKAFDDTLEFTQNYSKNPINEVVEIIKSLI